MRILLTGASGYIGSHLLPLLAGANEIITLGRTQAPVPGIRHIEFDLLRGDLEIVSSLGCDALVHLAWGLPHKDYWHDKSNIAWLGRSLELVGAFLNGGGRHIHIAGTCAEYDWCGPMPLSEKRSKIRPRGLYGRCKNALRAACVKMAKARGATLGWHRIFWLYGSNQDAQKFVPGLVSDFLNGGQARCNCANLNRDYIHIYDAAALIAGAIKANFNGPLNIGSGRAIPLGIIANLVAQKLACEEKLVTANVEINRDNPELVQAGLEGRSKLGGFYPKYSLETGLDEAIETFRKGL